jgi:hypothetical protein
LDSGEGSSLFGRKQALMICLDWPCCDFGSSLHRISFHLQNERKDLTAYSKYVCPDPLEADKLGMFEDAQWLSTVVLWGLDIDCGEGLEEAIQDQRQQDAEICHPFQLLQSAPNRSF